MFETLLKDQVQNVMSILGQTDGLAPERTYIDVNRGGSSYDPSTGAVTESATSYTGIPMVLARYKEEEIDGQKVVSTDQKAIIAFNDLPVTPSKYDKIVDGSRTFMVIEVGGVPGDSVWLLQLRETDN